MLHSPLLQFTPLPLSCQYFCPENVVCLIHLPHVFKGLKNGFTMEASTMNPDQTAPASNALKNGFTMEANTMNPDQSAPATCIQRNLRMLLP